MERDASVRRKLNGWPMGVARSSCGVQNGRIQNQPSTHSLQPEQAVEVLEIPASFCVK